MFKIKGDQASIIGGAIDFVKELEQLLHSLEAQKRMRKNKEGNESSTVVPSNGFFILPQFRIGSDEGNCGEEVKAENKSEVAEIEVTVIQTHVNLKIHSQRRPGQLLKAIVALEDLRLTVLHLNITSSESSVLYSFNLKVLVCLFLFLFSQPFWLEDQATLVLVTFFFFFFLFSYIILRLSVILIYCSIILDWCDLVWVLNLVGDADGGWV